MSTVRKPGNEPDPGDMSPEFDPAEMRKPATTDLVPAEEEEAAKLGDFA